MPGTLRRWRSHKVVEAGKIVAIEDHHVVVEGANGRVNIRRPNDLFARGRPMPGDYLVIYPDGYISWSPMAAFEDGYREERPALIVPGGAG